MPNQIIALILESLLLCPQDLFQRAKIGFCLCMSLFSAVGTDFFCAHGHTGAKAPGGNMSACADGCPAREQGEIFPTRL